MSIFGITQVKDAKDISGATGEILVIRHLSTGEFVTILNFPTIGLEVTLSRVENALRTLENCISFAATDEETKEQKNARWAKSVARNAPL